MDRIVDIATDGLHLSAHRGFLIVAQDREEQGRVATKFREFLLDEGFEMSQFSIYARFCNGKEQYETYLRRIERNQPERGDIHVLSFTDKQYENIVRFSSQKRQSQRKNPEQLVMF